MVNLASALKTLWTDKATIYEYTKTVDPDTHETIPNLIPVAENVPCRISFGNFAEYPTSLTDSVAQITQKVKLFLDKNITVTEGSVIEVTRNGVTEKYRRSGVPARYSVHQEIILEKYEDYA